MRSVCEPTLFLPIGLRELFLRFPIVGVCVVEIICDTKWSDD